MQKKLLVLAIAALASTSAFADSTVGFYGVLDAAVANVSGTGIQGGTTLVSGGLASSRFGVKATEGLDNGLTVVGVLEYQLDPETNQSLGTASTTTTTATGGLTAFNANAVYARQQMLALAGDFGTVATGYLQTTGWDFGAKYNVVAGSAVSPLGNLTKGQGFLIGDQAGAKRAQRAIAYISPSIGGLTVAVNYSAQLEAGYGDIPSPTTTADSNISATLISANYDAGPLSVGLVYAGTNSAASAGAANTDEYALGVAYAADVAKITATYQTSKHPNANVNGTAAVTAVPYTFDPTTGTITGTTGASAVAANPNATSSNSVYSIGAAIPVSVGVIALSYAGSTINTVASGAPSQNATSYSVAFLKPLSKTTTAYAAYSAVTQSNGTKGVTVANDLVGTDAGGNSSILALGLSKKF